MTYFPIFDVFIRINVDGEGGQGWGTGLKNYDVKMEDCDQIWKTARGKMGVL